MNVKIVQANYLFAMFTIEHPIEMAMSTQIDSKWVE